MDTTSLYHFIEVYTTSNVNFFLDNSALSLPLHDRNATNCQKAPSLAQINTFLWSYCWRELEYRQENHLFHLVTTCHLFCRCQGSNLCSISERLGHYSQCLAEKRSVFCVVFTANPSCHYVISKLQER